MCRSARLLIHSVHGGALWAGQQDVFPLRDLLIQFVLMLCCMALCVRLSGGKGKLWDGPVEIAWLS